MCAQGPMCLLDSQLLAIVMQVKFKKSLTNQRINLQSRSSLHHFEVEETKHDLNGNTNVLIHLQLQM